MLNRKERASQFMPFDALKGFQEVLKETEKQPTKKIELSEDSLEDLNRTLEAIKIGDRITIKYYDKIDYIETTGTLKRIDFQRKKIILSYSKIPMEEILFIKKT